MTAAGESRTAVFLWGGFDARTGSVICVIMNSSGSAANSPFMLLFRNAGPETHQHLSAEQRRQLAAQWNSWYESLAAAGKVKHGQPLALNGRVVSGARGERVVDGPYAESKEVVGGYLFLTVADLDEATEIAKQCPGLPLGLMVEVRPLASESPVLEGVSARPPE